VIQVAAHSRILLAIEPVDFRAGIDGLARVCRERLRADPFQGAVFVFRNRARSALKLMAHELHVLLCGGDPTATQALPAWKLLIMKP